MASEAPQGSGAGVSGSSSSSSSGKEKRINMLLKAFNQNENDDSVLNMLQRWKDLHSNPLVKSIRAVTLLRTNQRTQSLEVVNQLQTDQIIGDDQVLDNVLRVYTSTGHNTEATQVLEKALESKPNDTRLLRQLYSCHLAMGNLQQQQRAGMKLYKATEDPLYMVWAALAIALQSKRLHWEEVRENALEDRVLDLNTGSPKAQQSLKFCVAMLEKAVPNGKVTHSEAVGFYLHVLRQSGKQKEALDALKGPCREIRDIKNMNSKRESADSIPSIKEPVKFLPIDYLKEEVDLLCSNAQWELAWKKTCHLLIWHDNDDWSLFQTVVECCFQYLRMNCGIGAQAFHDQERDVIEQLQREEECDQSTVELPPSIERLYPSISNTRAVFTCIQRMTLQENGKRACLRGAFLAEILLEARVLEHSRSSVSQVRESSVSICLKDENFLDIVSARDYKLTCDMEHAAESQSLCHLIGWINRYLSLFGAKPCCFSDLSSFLTPFVVPDSGVREEQGSQRPLHPPFPESVLRPDFPKCSFISTSFAPLRFFDTHGFGKIGAFPNFAVNPSSSSSFPCSFDSSDTLRLEASEAERNNFVALLRMRAEDVDPTNIKQLQRFITEQKILQFTNVNTLRGTGEDGARNLVRSYCELWRRFTSQSVNTSGSSSDFRAGDDLILLATGLLEALAVHSYQSSKRSETHRLSLQYIFDCVRLTEVAYASSPNNFNLCRKLLKLYDLLGAVEPFGRRFECLGVKHIQWESMGHLLLSTTTRLGFHDYSLLGVEEICKVHREENRETSFYMKRAIEHNNYSTVLDLQRMQERMKFSLSRNEARSLRGFLSNPMKNAAEVHRYLRSVLLVGEYPELCPDMDVGRMDALAVDNRDFSLYINNWNPPNNRLLHQLKSYYRENTILQTRQVQALHFCVLWLLEGDVNAATTNIGVLEDVTKQLAGMWGKYQKLFECSSSFVPYELLPFENNLAYVGRSMRVDIMECILSCSRFALECLKYSKGIVESSTLETSGEEIMRQISEIVEDLSGHILTANGGESLNSPSKFWAKSALVVTILLHYSALFLSAAVRVLPVSSKKQQKKKSKRKGNKVDDANHEGNSADRVYNTIKKLSSVVMQVGKTVRRAKNLSEPSLSFLGESPIVEPVLQEHLKEQQMTENVKCDIASSFEKQGNALQAITEEIVSYLKAEKL
eukprot:gb/GECG01000238.1/.p1 GENE.gb/GECG01000238.1/~~gb/GECG01000238.1/.p1  ORF type:complete len:1188 (+),score=166.74 gb/GECG01000238.1/:1-3564(+)